MKRVVPEDQKRGEGTGLRGAGWGCIEDVKEEPDTRTSDRLPVHVQMNFPMQIIQLNL